MWRGEMDVRSVSQSVTSAVTVWRSRRRQMNRFRRLVVVPLCSRVSSVQSTLRKGFVTGGQSHGDFSHGVRCENHGLREPSEALEVDYAGLLVSLNSQIKGTSRTKIDTGITQCGAGEEHQAPQGQAGDRCASGIFFPEEGRSGCP